jgi:FkbM family methyltransferase
VSLRGKLETASFLIKREGFGTLLKELGRRYLGTGKPRPEEVEIVFKAFQSQRRTGVMIDVGAHFGGALKPFAQSGWKVFAFEPDASNRAKLQQAVGASKNVVIDPRGVSDQVKSNVPFFTSNVSTGISGLSAFHSSHTASGAIDLTTVERVCSDQKLEHIDFLKIDTEGFDLFVLKGVPWDKIKPDVVVCEFEDSKTLPLGYSVHDLAHFLEERGYRLVVSEWHPIRQYGVLHDWNRFVRYPCRLKDEKAWGNIIAARSDSLMDSIVAACGQYAPVERADGIV